MLLARRNAWMWLILSCTLFAASRSVWDGVYTAEQAERGLKVYRQECARCHAENLMGGEAGPALAGADFLQKWNGKSVGQLFEITRKTMPLEDPGNLSSRQYTDVVAYMLKANAFPAGQTELDRDPAVLNEIRIEAKR